MCGAFRAEVVCGLYWHVSMHGDCLLMLGSVAMERNTQHTARHQYWSASMCLFVWNKMMQKGRDAFSSILIGLALYNSVFHWLAFAHCFVNGWPAVTWQFVDPIIFYVLVCKHVDVCMCTFVYCIQKTLLCLFISSPYHLFWSG